MRKKFGWKIEADLIFHALERMLSLLKICTYAGLADGGSWRSVFLIGETGFEFVLF
jgi:hypothetical protein